MIQNCLSPVKVGQTDDIFLRLNTRHCGGLYEEVSQTVYGSKTRAEEKPKFRLWHSSEDSNFSNSYSLCTVFLATR